MGHSSVSKTRLYVPYLKCFLYTPPDPCCDELCTDTVLGQPEQRLPETVRQGYRVGTACVCPEFFVPRHCSAVENQIVIRQSLFILSFYQGAFILDPQGPVPGLRAGTAEMPM